MNDLLLLGIVLGGCPSLLMIVLFNWQHLEHKKSAYELKALNLY